MGSKQKKKKLSWLFVGMNNSVIEVHPPKVHSHNYLALINYNDYIATLNYALYWHK